MKREERGICATPCLRLFLLHYCLSSSEVRLWSTLHLNQGLSRSRGIVLFIIAAKDIIVGQDEKLEEDEMYGVVPLVCLCSRSCRTRNIDHHPEQLRLCLFLCFPCCEPDCLCNCSEVLQYIIKYLGKRFVEAMSKVFSLIIASIAIMFIRKGLQGLF